MQEKAPQNPDYKLEHPEAIEDVDTAHEIALESNETRSHATLTRQAAKIAVRAVRYEENQRRRGNISVESRTYIDNLRDRAIQEERTNAFEAAILDSAQEKLRSTNIPLYHEEGRGKFKRLAEDTAALTDERAETKENNKAAELKQAA